MPYKDTPENRIKIQEYKKKWKIANRDRINENERLRRKDKRRKVGLRGDCEGCNRLGHTAQQIKQSIKDRKTAQRNLTNSYIQNYKENSPCKCGESRPPTLQFHHRDPATKMFAVSKSKDKTINEIKQEIEKCDVLCANCHIIHHWEINKTQYPKNCKSEIVIKRKQHGCSRCNNLDHRCLQFHHRDPKTKKFTISNELRKTRVDETIFREEIDKCDIICANCHAILHHEQRQTNKN